MSRFLLKAQHGLHLSGFLPPHLVGRAVLSEADPMGQVQPPSLVLSTEPAAAADAIKDRRVGE